MSGGQDASTYTWMSGNLGTFQKWALRIRSLLLRFSLSPSKLSPLTTDFDWHCTVEIRSDQ